MRWSKPQSAPHPMLRTRDLALPVMSKSTGNDGWAGPAQPVRQEGSPAAMRVEVVPPARQVAARFLLHIPQLHAI